MRVTRRPRKDQPRKVSRSWDRPQTENEEDEESWRERDQMAAQREEEQTLDVSLVFSLEARLRAVEAATYSVVLVQRETSLPYKNMREAGRKYAQLVEAKGADANTIWAVRTSTCSWPSCPHWPCTCLRKESTKQFWAGSRASKRCWKRSSSTRHRQNWESGSRRAEPRTATTGLSRTNRVASSLPRKGRWKCRGALPTPNK